MTIEPLTSRRFRRQAARVFKALADENRLGLLLMLRQRCCEGGCDVKSPSAQRTLADVGRDLGVSKATISHHLRLLSQAGLVTRARRGRRVACAISLSPLQAVLEAMLGRHPTKGGIP